MPFFARSPLRKLGRSPAEGRRRGEAEGVSALAFDLDTLELVPVDSEVGLLRVAGRWTAPAVRPLQEIVLSLSVDGNTLNLHPLPDLGGAAPLASPDGEPWRGAYTVRMDLVEDPHAQLALIADREAPVAIPRPSDWESLRGGAAEPPSKAAQEQGASETGAPADRLADEPWQAELERLAQLQIEAERVAEELEASDADLNAKVETMAEGFKAIRQALKALNKAEKEVPQLDKG
jgi:hypothetical protein